MRFFQRRQAEASRAAATTVAPPKTKISKPALTKIILAISDHSPAGFNADYPLGQVDHFAVRNGIANMAARAWGSRSFTPSTFFDYIDRDGTTEEVLDVIEMWFAWCEQLRGEALRGGGGMYPGGYSPYENVLERMSDSFRDRINDVFDEHDLGWRVIGVEVVPQGSTAMYAGVVEPTVTLLASEGRYESVERAYRDALHEMKPGGNAGDAVTDAGTALQEMLRARGARGVSLGPLLSDAKTKGIIGPYDSKLASAIETIGQWMAADRTTSGDAHLANVPTTSDAWLAIHVAGALIIRLSEGDRG